MVLEFSDEDVLKMRAMQVEIAKALDCSRMQRVEAQREVDVLSQVIRLLEQLDTLLAGFQVVEAPGTRSRASAKRKRRQ